MEGKKERQAFKAHLQHNIMPMGPIQLTADQAKLLYAMVDVYDLRHKRDLMLQLEYFSYHEPRLDVLTRHLKMAVPDIREFRKIEGRIKKALPNF